MNTQKLAENVYARVRLRPIARRHDGVQELEQIDDQWIVTEVTSRGVRVQNERTGHAPILGFDHVHHYVSDPGRDGDGLKHGFLDLDVQLTLCGRNVFPEPLRRHRPRRY